VQPNGLSASTFFGSSGAGGDLRITTPQLTVRDGSVISVGSLGTGNAGNMTLEVGSLKLDNGAIAANNLVGEGGNVDLRVSEELVLRNRSEISTRAGNEQSGGGNGGNITINTNTIALLQGSNINANAFEGNGGNIQITTQGIFVSPDSAIAASSQLGVDGVVEIITPDVDSGAGLVELPENLTAPTTQIVAGCPSDRGNRFVVTGSGGLPTNPAQPLRGQAIWQDVRDLPSPQGAGAAVRTTDNRQLTPDTIPGATEGQIVEATGWIVNSDGRVELIANVPHRRVECSWCRPTECRD
jgi:large exoprotein involved in heme utilization and adhesion